jgi:hypothetical protein
MAIAPLRIDASNSQRKINQDFRPVAGTGAVLPQP